MESLGFEVTHAWHWVFKTLFAISLLRLDPASLFYPCAAAAATLLS